MVQWKPVTQQSQNAETSRELDSFVHDPEPGIEIENLWSEERHFFRCIDKDQSCRLLGMVAGEASDNEATVGVPHQNVRSWETRVSEQSVEFFGACCDCASSCDRLAPAVSGSIIGTNAGELGDSILDGPPKPRWLTCPLFDKDARVGAPLAN